MAENTEEQSIRKELTRLARPICYQNLFSALIGTADTLMLAPVGDIAVGAVGTASSYINLFFVLLSIATSGMTVVMSYYIGAGKDGIAQAARKTGLRFNSVLGTCISLFFIFCSGIFVKIVGMSEDMVPMTSEYLRIVGGASVLDALNAVFSSHLSAYGYTKKPFIVGVISNLLNIILNAVFLYALHMGVTGVALASAITKVVSLILLSAWSRRIYKKPESLSSNAKKSLLREILCIGLPSTLEHIVFAFSMAMVVSIVNNYDSSGFAVSARSYALQAVNLTQCCSTAFGSANGIIIGWKMGAGDHEAAKKSCRLSSMITLCIVVPFSVIAALVAKPIMSLFSDDHDMQNMVRTLLFINVAIQIGRALNLSHGGALKAVGDVKFNMILGITSMLLVMVGGTWVLCDLGWMFPAVAGFIAQAADELGRSVCNIARWRSEVWKKKKVFTL